MPDMNIFDRIRNLFTPLLRHRPVASKSRQSEPRRGGIIVAGTGCDPMAIATVYCCVKLLSESVANLPIRPLREKDGIFVEDTGAYGRRLWYLLNVQPSPGVNAFDFHRRMVQDVLCCGNAYIVPVYSPVDMEIERLVLCTRGSVSHDTENDTYTVSDKVNNLFGVFDQSEVIHIKGLTGFNPKVGLSVLSYASQTIGIAAAGDIETENRFVNGGNVRGILSNSDSVSGFGEFQDTELSRTAGDVDERFRNGERIVSIPGQTSFSPLSLSSADMEFLSSRKFTVREICRFFGVHPSFVFDDTSNNYKSAEQANVAFLSHTLAPLLRCIEVEMLCKLYTAESAARRRVEFDRRGLYACDLEGLMRYRQGLLQIGTTVNEVRRMDNLPPVEGGDTILISANLRNINEAAPGTPAQPETKNNKSDDHDKTEDNE